MSHSEKVWKMPIHITQTVFIWTWNCIPVLRSCSLDSYLLKDQESKGTGNREESNDSAVSLPLDSIQGAFTQRASHLWQSLLPTHTQSPKQTNETQIS